MVLFLLQRDPAEGTNKYFPLFKHNVSVNKFRQYFFIIYVIDSRFDFEMLLKPTNIDSGCCSKIRLEN